MIYTERLQIRKYTLLDAPFIYELMNSEGWLKNIGNRNINSIADAEAYLERHYLSIYSSQGFGPYKVLLKDSSTAIGSCGLYKRDNLDFPDIGFAFLPEFVGQGYALEAAKAIMKYASEELKIEKIVGITLPENITSVKLLKKIGLAEIGTYNFEYVEELLLFST
ncbi:GNAT family N-acetyltransferase [Aequorivita echinoideorum]|uniref:GNAT family N-acetyltransferase n=1 Tax=Aequorivita echinoideorum TaxID=1549647 RepID=A0ABS5S5Z2_9FLAO|nr:GNAT family N-acetyltransferase [Aequorivita echinoideorum]MBT0608629.1 GNAT family N-acetyltransferase [Aequorivita echinoideorum]